MLICVVKSEFIIWEFLAHKITLKYYTISCEWARNTYLSIFKARYENVSLYLKTLFPYVLSYKIYDIKNVCSKVQCCVLCFYVWSEVIKRSNL